MTAIASARRITPRAPGIAVTRPFVRGLRPDATPIDPSAARTAAAQWVGPCTSRPLRRAMPPRRRVSGGCSTDLLRGVVEEVRGRPEIGDRDPLVGGVDQRRGLVERHLAVREEAIGDEVRERIAERPRVREAREDRRDDAGTGL